MSCEVRLSPEILSHYRGKKILISGASGYLSTALTQALAQVSCKIILLTRKNNLSLPADAQADFKVLTGDIRNLLFWRKALENADFLFHFAAQTSVPFAEQNPETDFEINVLPIMHIAEVLHTNQKKLAILFAGTVTQAGIPNHLPVDESEVDQPMTIYDQHKLMAEKRLELLSTENLAKTVTLRISNVYGPGNASSSLDRGILNKMIACALRGQDLHVFRPSDLLRDYIYIGDVVQAFLTAGTKIDGLNGNHFILGKGEGHSLLQAFQLVAHRVEHLRKKKVTVKEINSPKTLSPIDKRNFVANIHGLSKATGWTPKTNLKEGIDLTIQSL